MRVSLPVKAAGIFFSLLVSLGAAVWVHCAQTHRSSRELSLSDAERVLLAAAREGETELVAGLVHAGTPVETRDGRGFTPLILAAYHGHEETVRALLTARADACAGDGRGNTALMGAAFKGHAGVVKLLLEKPCAVDQANRVGQTALMFARLFGRSEVAGLLEQAGASEAVRDSQGRSAEDWAATQGTSSPVASKTEGR